MGNITEKINAASSRITHTNETINEAPKKLKPCCACPETKKARDAWYV